MGDDSSDAAYLSRYARHISIPDVGLSGQRTLSDSRVLCVGAGGLGSPVLLYLAAAGVGTLGVVDFDQVESSNLQRQIIHTEAAVGQPKVDSAAAALAALNSGVRVERHDTRLDQSNARDLFARYDVIVDGADNFATRYLVNDAAVLEGKPYVWASLFRFEGQVSVFDAARGPCYRCLYAEPPPPGMVPSCAEGGILGAVCGMVGSIQATETLKLLLGIGTPLRGRLLVVDALRMRIRELAVAKDPRCALCGPNATISQVTQIATVCEAPARDRVVTPRELHTRLRLGAPVSLIDVREPYEAEIVTIEGSTLVPRGRFDVEDPARLLPDGPVVLYCKSGARSAAVLQRLVAAGRADVAHLDGGVLAWVREIEPDLPSY